MGMIVQHNMNALNAYNKLNSNVAGLKKSSEKLSSGYRINRAGDDAAGLAISEKMRSQIRGLNQAKRNSQDGISMIQTFEGAAQETHSILQRMKELATESANGTYDNPTDRAAIQLEFDQLNDELNQIADTDFNGTIVLNGGQMADGTKAVNGEFNYVTAVRDPKQLGASDIEALDNTKISKKAADAAWKAWSDGKGAYARDDTDLKNDGPESIDIEFQYDGKGRWEAIGVSDGGFDLDKINAGIVKTGSIPIAESPSNGGFILTTEGSDGKNKQIANVLVNTSTLKAGDTIKLTVKNPLVNNSVAMNFGVSEIDRSGLIDVGTIDKDNGLGQVTWKASSTFSNTYAPSTTKPGMTPKLKALHEALEGAKLSVTYNGKDTSATKVKLHLTGETNAVTATADGADLMVNGEKVGVVKYNDAGLVEILDETGGNLLATFTLVNSDDNATAGKKATKGDIVYTLSNSEPTYDVLAAPTVNVKAPDNSAVSKSNSYGNSTARMTYTDNLTLQTGARTKDSVNFTFQYNTDQSADMGELKANLNLSARADGLNTENLSLATQKDANYAIDQIDKAINKTSMVRASFGAIQNRLEHKIENLTTTAENLTEAEAGIRDTDMASEMMNYTKFNILQQAAQSMLAQANQQPQSILQLLG